MKAVLLFMAVGPSLQGYSVRTMLCTSNSDRIGVSHAQAESGYVFSDLSMVDLLMDLDVSAHLAVV